MSYIDSRGAEMDDMSFTEALHLIHNLASDNEIDGRDAEREAGLASQRAWQDLALNTLEELVAVHGDAIDNFAASERAQDWPEAVTAATRSMDAAVPTNATRICLDSAQHGALDPRDCARDPHLADECDRQQQAFDIVRDLLGMHGEAIDALARPLKKSARRTPGKP